MRLAVVAIMVAVARHPGGPAADRHLTMILNSNENRCHEVRRPSSPRCRRPARCGGVRAPVGTRADDAPDGRSSAAFYPLEFVAERVGGRRTCEVTNLTKPGAEPHDLELTPKARRVARRRDGRGLPGGLPAGRRRGRRRQAADAAVDVSRPRASTLTLAATTGTTTPARRRGARGPRRRRRPRPALLARPAPVADVGDAVADELAELDPATPPTTRPTPPPCARTSTALDAEYSDRPGAVRAHASWSPATTPSATSPTATG